MNRLRSSLLVGLGVVALVVPAAAVANQGSHGKGHGKGHGKTPNVAFIFRGVYEGENTVNVESGNAHARKGGFVGQKVSFDLTTAAVVVADFNGDTQSNLEDVQVGDHVLVKARLPRKTEWQEGEEAITAQRLVDQTHPPTS
jgi:hypothetical protein